MKAEDSMMVIAEKLSKFGLNLKHIVGMVTDGATIVDKTGWLSKVLHQICRSHGIHLAMVDVLYKKNNAGEHDDESFDSETIHEVTANEDCDLELSEKIEIVINKIRMVVRIFHRSPVKNDVLQKNCQAEFNKELNLIMDTRTQ